MVGRTSTSASQREHLVWGWWDGWDSDGGWASCVETTRPCDPAFGERKGARATRFGSKPETSRTPSWFNTSDQPTKHRPIAGALLPIWIGGFACRLGCHPRRGTCSALTDLSVSGRGQSVTKAGDAIIPVDKLPLGLITTFVPIVQAIPQWLHAPDKGTRGFVWRHQSSPPPLLMARHIPGRMRFAMQASSPT